MGMVALRGNALPDLRRIAGHFRESLNLAVDDSEINVRDEAAVVTIEGGMAGFVFMPMPIPWGDLEWPVCTAWSWPEARSSLSGHGSHVVVYASSEKMAPVRLSLCLTRAIASVLASVESLGVYYGNASIVVPPDRYLEQASEASETSLPLFLWLGFHPVPEKKGLSGYTTGMRMLGFLDLEVHDTNMKPSESLGMLADIAHYELSSGIQIGRGETIGATDEERHRIVHRKSRFGNREITCQILL